MSVACWTDERRRVATVVECSAWRHVARPHAVAHDEEYRARTSNYAMRHHVKPGLTGAAQVAGLRGETRQLGDMAQRVERDLWYIDNWSLTLDLKVLAQTFVALLEHQSY